MVMKLSSVQQTSDDAEWEDSREFPDVKYKVRPADYGPYQVARDNLLQKLQRTYKDAPIPDKVWKPQHGKIIANHLLEGWEGFDEPYDAARAVEMLGDWTWRALADDIMSASRRRSQVDGEFLDDAAKNSAAPFGSTLS